MINTVHWITAIFGFAHAVYTFRQALDRPGGGPGRLTESWLRASYFALWTLLLWLVFGGYVVLLWVVGVIPYLIARSKGRTVEVQVPASR